MGSGDLLAASRRRGGIDGACRARAGSSTCPARAGGQGRRVGGEFRSGAPAPPRVSEPGQSRRSNHRHAGCRGDRGELTRAGRHHRAAALPLSPVATFAATIASDQPSPSTDPNAIHRPVRPERPRRHPATGPSCVQHPNRYPLRPTPRRRCCWSAGSAERRCECATGPPSTARPSPRPVSAARRTNFGASPTPARASSTSSTSIAAKRWTRQARRTTVARSNSRRCGLVAITSNGGSPRWGVGSTSSRTGPAAGSLDLRDGGFDDETIIQQWTAFPNDVNQQWLVATPV